MPSSEGGRVADPRARWVLAAVALGCIVLMALVYVVAVRTAWGQRVDETAVIHHRYDRTPGHDIRLYDAGAIVAMVVVGAGVVVMTVPRWRLLGVLSGSIATAVVVANVLRRLVLVRPNLGVFDMLYGPSYPSGHATAAVTIAAALVVVCPWPPWLRRSVALAIAAGIDGVVLFIPIHRPSDVIGGNLLGLAVMCIAIAAFGPHPWVGAADGPSPLWRRVAVFGGIGLVEFAVMFGVMSRLAHRSDLSIHAYGPGFAVGLLVDVLSAAVVLATFEHLIARVRTPSSADTP